jgi:cyclophilin family peptidyl-prolyl cis-trans isomerase/TolA-binding protein
MRILFVFALLTAALWLICPSLGAQDETAAAEESHEESKSLKKEMNLEMAKAIKEELEALRDKIQSQQKEITTLKMERSQAEPERQNEIESQLLLKERAYGRLAEALGKKEQECFDATTALIAQNPETAEFHALRFKSAFALKRYDIVLEDLVYVKEDTAEIHMMWAQSLEWFCRFCRFKEAIPHYEKAIPKMSEMQRPFVRFSLGNCHLNAGNFTKAHEYYSGLAKDAPPDKRAHFDRFAKEAANYMRYWEKERILRDQEAEKDDNPQVLLELEKGQIRLELFEDQAPNTVANFITLVESGFYDGLLFHRVNPQMMVQAGCPEGTGRGGPGYKIADECRQENARMHFVGTLSMANDSRPNTGGSQFFITTVNTWWLNGKHTVFGRVLEGRKVVNGLQQGDRIISAKVLRKRDHAYEVKKL